MSHCFEICHYQQNMPQHYYLLDTLVNKYNDRVWLNNDVGTMNDVGMVVVVQTELLWRFTLMTSHSVLPKKLKIDNILSVTSKILAANVDRFESN